MSQRGVIAARLGASAVAVGGLLFALYQVLRPFRDNAVTMASGAWLASHLCAIGGFALIALGLVALPWLQASSEGPVSPGSPGSTGGEAASRGQASSVAAVVATWLGAGLTLPYYGAETFALSVIARRSLAADDPDVLSLVDEFHTATVAVVTFAFGLILMGAGVVLAAVGVARSGAVGWHHGVVLAVAYLLLIPQFYTPQPVRIVHGLLVLAGALWLAVGLLRWPRRADGH